MSALSRLISVLVIAIGLPLQTRAQDDAPWLRWFSRDLRSLDTQIQSTHTSLAKLDVPVMSQTTAELGYQHPQLREPPPTAPWLQIDLGSPQAIDWVALVPALVDWKPDEQQQKTYGFPRRFRIDISDDPSFATFTPLAVHTDEDFRSPGLAPAVFRAHSLRGRHLRLTVTKLAEENGTHFFALSELMVIQGIHNIAFGKAVTASRTTTLPPRWHIDNLVDGRSPLGPPIERHLLPYDGLFADQSDPEHPGWITLDLGSSQPLDEIRLHPVHARLGADVPGFAFPLRFRVELSDGPTFTQSIPLLDSSHADYSNPGNNPVIIPVHRQQGRYLRMLMVLPSPGRRDSFGLSEIEVFANGDNLASSATVTATPDRADRPEQRPPSLIVDHHTSYGRLIPFPEWFARWQTRLDLQNQLHDLQQQRPHLQTIARRRVWITGSTIVFLLPSLGIALALHERRQRRRALLNLRNRLAQDLHDEIGSNIAGIAMISETTPVQDPDRQTADLEEIHRIAQETTEAMREVLWLVGARAESGPDFTALLQRTTHRLLSGHQVHWTSLPTATPTYWPAESRRQVFLFFKEALTNIARHARANKVDLSLTFTDHKLHLTIQDNGIGFDPNQKSPGLGLTSMKQRARTLHGQMSISPTSPTGTLISLTVPL